MNPLQPFPFTTPGVFGLNKQGQTANLPPEWCTVATNLVIDDKGRLANRNGYRRMASNATADDIETVHYGVSNTGAKTTYCADKTGALYELVAGAWVDKTGTVTLPSDGNWQFANFNGKVVAWHADGRQVVQSAPGANFANITGSPPQGVAMCAAFGRLWVVDNTTLYFCELLNETIWSGGTAGTFALKYAWPRGADIATGVSEFNGRLLVFGETSVIMYGDDSGMSIADPNTSMLLLDTVDNVGCINRDTIQKAGSDILFLSNVGLQSFGRVIQQKSSPITDVVPQVRDYVASAYAASVANKVTSAYASDYGLYLLSLAGTTIVVDTRVSLPNGGYRVTEWNAVGCCGSYGGGLYLANADVLSYYTGILDEVAYDGSGGTAVEGDWESGWFDWESVGQGLGVRNKFLKRYRMSVSGGGSGTVTLKWYFDYGESANTRAVAIPAPPNAAQYAIAKYATDVYGTSVDVTDLSKNAAKGGRVTKIGAKINGSTTTFAINQAILYATLGKQAH